ncbi:hypothetical protein ACHAWU_002093 [Discostella pseudostelligera]|uniref:Uncharacterized protein n=1 Tax=Discostella pseudostelligera TaxID=259834 RepID=A0ABD3MAQ9_9STRA
MKFSTTATEAMLVVMAATNTYAFSPSSTTRMQRKLPSRQTTSTTRLDLLPAMESSTVITSLGGVTEGLGSLALLGSVGFGLAFSNWNDPNWSYEYKVGNDGNYVGGSATATADLALLEESPVSVMEKVEEETAAAATPVTVKDVAVATKTARQKKPPPLLWPRRKEILQSTEVAKAEVQKVGVQEVKERMSTKVTAASSPVTPSASTPPPAESQSSSSSKEVAEIKETKNGKGAVAKGVGLIVAAGAVAVVRNFIKAYLGRGLL